MPLLGNYEINELFLLHFYNCLLILYFLKSILCKEDIFWLNRFLFLEPTGYLHEISDFFHIISVLSQGFRENWIWAFIVKEEISCRDIYFFVIFFHNTKI